MTGIQRTQVRILAGSQCLFLPTAIRVYHNNIVFQSLVGTFIAFDVGSLLCHKCYHGLNHIPTVMQDLHFDGCNIVGLHTDPFSWHQVTVKHVLGIFHVWVLGACSWLHYCYHGAS